MKYLRNKRIYLSGSDITSGRKSAIEGMDQSTVAGIYDILPFLIHIYINKYLRGDCYEQVGQPQHHRQRLDRCQDQLPPRHLQEHLQCGQSETDLIHSTLTCVNFINTWFITYFLYN